MFKAVLRGQPKECLVPAYIETCEDTWLSVDFATVEEGLGISIHSALFVCCRGSGVGVTESST